MITALPWQLQACIGELVFSLMLGLYWINAKPVNFRLSKKADAVWLVWDAAFLALFIWGAPHFSIWYLFVAGYYVFSIWGRTRKMRRPVGEPGPERIVQEINGEKQDVTDAVRGFANMVAGVVYISLLVMVALG